MYFCAIDSFSVVFLCDEMVKIWHIRYSMFQDIHDLCQWSRYNHTNKTEMQSVRSEMFASRWV